LFTGSADAGIALAILVVLLLSSQSSFDCCSQAVLKESGERVKLRGGMVVAMVDR